MKLKIFTIHDSKAEAYLQPFFAQNEQVALRMFASSAQDANHQFHKFAGDYTLFLLGEFDDQNASVTMLAAAENIGCAINFLGADLQAAS